MAVTLPSIKRGDTFYFDAILWDGAQVSELKCQVRNPVDDMLLSDAVITVLDAATNTFRVTVADTTGWPIGPVELDVQRTVGTVVTSSDTVKCKILKDVTL